MKRLLKRVITKINRLFYPDLDMEKLKYSSVMIFTTGVVQKIIGINRHVPWPVHWTTTVSDVKKIDPGTRTPGLSRFCYLDGRNGIVFGKNVRVGPYVKIISMNHDIYNFDEFITDRPIVIGDNSWIGAGAIILPGVRLGSHTIVGAGAVVTKSFEEGNQLIAGNPARVLKRLEEYREQNA